MSSTARDMEQPMVQWKREVLQCRLCSSDRLGTLPFGYGWDGRWFGAVHCRNCEAIFLDPQPTPADIARMYTREYFEKDFRCGHTGSYFDEATRYNLENDPLLQRIVRMKSPPAQFLEIGCAGGAFLTAAQSKGYVVTGIEFSDQAAQFAREHYRLNVFTGEITTAKLADNTFDIVFMGDVLEHILNPVPALKEIHRVLRPGGMIAIVCPSQTNTLYSRLGFIFYGLLGRRATVQLPPYHSFEYRPASIVRLLERCGFHLLQLRNEIIPPSEIALRGPRLQRILKFFFQYPNLAITTTLGRWGDRIELFAVKV